MSNNSEVGGPLAGRLDQISLKKLFDFHPPLDSHEAAVAADRCYFCYDAPCVTACPTDIDISFYKTNINRDACCLCENDIDQNILGGMCARGLAPRKLCAKKHALEKSGR